MKEKIENSFFQNLREFGIGRIIKSADFILSTLITAFLVFLFVYHKIKITVDYELTINILTGLFAFVFAALAILISFSDQKFVAILVKAKVFKKLLFHYWLGCVVFLCSIFVIYVLSFFNEEYYWCDCLVVYIFSYSIFFALELVKTTITFGLYREKII